jgi:hypothetical protein
MKVTKFDQLVEQLTGMSDKPWHDDVDATEPGYGGERITRLEASRLYEVCDGNEDYLTRLGNPQSEQEWKDAVAKVKVNWEGKFSDIQREFEDQMKIQ